MQIVAAVVAAAKDGAEGAFLLLSELHMLDAVGWFLEDEHGVDC